MNFKLQLLSIMEFAGQLHCHPLTKDSICNFQMLLCIFSSILLDNTVCSELATRLSYLRYSKGYEEKESYYKEKHDQRVKAIGDKCH